MSDAPLEHLPKQGDAMLALPAMEYLQEMRAVVPPHIRRFAELALAVQGCPDAPHFRPWEKNAMKHVMRSFMPTVRFEELAEMSAPAPAMEGKVSGYFTGLMLLFRAKLLPKLAEREKLEPVLAKFWPNFIWVFLEPVLSKYSLADAQVYFRNFANALSSLQEIGIPASQNDSIVLAVLIFGSEQVSQLRNTTELHQFLVKVLGHNLAGSLKRLRSLCQRIGLSYPDKGGRPAKRAKPGEN